METFEIIGRDKQTGAAVRMTLEAANAVDAVSTADRMGITVVSLGANSAPAAEPGYASPKNSERGSQQNVEMTEEFVDRQQAGVSPTVTPERLKLKYLAILFGIEALIPLFATIVMLLDKHADTGDRVIGFFVAWSLWAIFCGLQYGFLAPVERPVISNGKGKHPFIWISSIVAGLICGALLCGLFFLFGDILHLVGLLTSNTAANAVLILGLLIMLVSWGFSTYFISGFLAKGPLHQRLGKVSGTLFIGSVADVIASIPIVALINKKHSCICESFSFMTMIAGTALGFFLTGPGILLLLLRRRSRAANHLICTVCGHDRRHDLNRDQCGGCGSGWKVPA